MVFPADVRSWSATQLVEDAVVVVRGRLDKREDLPKLVAMELTCPTCPTGPRGPVVITLPVARCVPPVVERLKEVLATHPGVTEVHLQLQQAGGRTTVMRLDDGLRVTAAPALFGDLKALLGPGSVGVTEPGPLDPSGSEPTDPAQDPAQDLAQEPPVPDSAHAGRRGSLLVVVRVVGGADPRGRSDRRGVVAVAPVAAVRMQSDGGFFLDPDPETYVASDLWFALLSVVAGVLAGILLWPVVRRGPTAGVAGLAVGGLRGCVRGAAPWVSCSAGSTRRRSPRCRTDRS